MGHDVERHVHVGVLDRVLGALGNKGLERAEGQRMQQNADAFGIVAHPEDGFDLLKDFSALIGIGSVGVEEDRAATGGFYFGNNPFHIGHGGAAVQVHSENMHSG